MATFAKINALSTRWQGRSAVVGKCPTAFWETESVSWWRSSLVFTRGLAGMPCGKRRQSGAVVSERRRTTMRTGRRVGESVNRAKRLRQTGAFREVRSGMALVELGLLSDTQARESHSDCRTLRSDRVKSLWRIICSAMPN